MALFVSYGAIPVRFGEVYDFSGRFVVGRGFPAPTTPKSNTKPIFFVKFFQIQTRDVFEVAHGFDIPLDM